MLFLKAIPTRKNAANSKRGGEKNSFPIVDTQKRYFQIPNRKGKKRRRGDKATKKTWSEEKEEGKNCTAECGRQKGKSTTTLWKTMQISQWHNLKRHGAFWKMPSLYVCVCVCRIGCCFHSFPPFHSIFALFLFISCFSFLFKFFLSSLHLYWNSSWKAAYCHAYLDLWCIMAVCMMCGDVYNEGAMVRCSICSEIEHHSWRYTRENIVRVMAEKSLLCQWVLITEFPRTHTQTQ